MKKFLTYLLLAFLFIALPFQSSNLNVDLGDVKPVKEEVVYINKMHVNCTSWNSHVNGESMFQAATSKTYWEDGYYWNVLYVYGSSHRGDEAVATYITNFQIHAIASYGDEVVYQDRYLLINYGEARAIASLYNLDPNVSYFITWDNCNPY